MYILEMSNSSDLTYDAALTAHPTAKTAWDACNAEGILNTIYNKVNSIASSRKGQEEIAERYGLAIKEFASEFPKAIERLPNSTLAELMQRSFSENFQDKEALKILYASYDPQKNPAYSSWDMNNLAVIGDALRKDPLIKDAKENWSEYSEEERLLVAEKIQTIQANAYGFSPRKIVAESSYIGIGSAAPDWLQKFLPESYFKGEEGHYSSDTDTLTLNSFRGFLGLRNPPLTSDDFDKFVDLVLHEGDHAFQDYISESLNKLRGVEDAWFLQNKVNAFPMDDKTNAGYQKHMKEWIDKKFTNHYEKNLNESLLVGGAMREIAQVMDINLNIFNASEDYAGAELPGEGYMLNPAEKSAFGLDGYASKIFSADGEGYIQGFLNSSKEWDTIISDSSAQIEREYKIPNPVCAAPLP